MANSDIFVFGTERAKALIESINLTLPKRISVFLHSPISCYTGNMAHIRESNSMGVTEQWCHCGINYSDGVRVLLLYTGMS